MKPMHESKRLTLTFLVLFSVCSMIIAENTVNLVPSQPGDTLDYFCTWSLQYYLGGNINERHARDVLTESQVFGPEGWARIVFPQVRGDLYLVLDDGWDLPMDPQLYEAYYGSMEVQIERWPSCTGSFEQRLRKLNELAQDCGWKGVGLWICSQESKAVVSRDRQAWLDQMPADVDPGVFNDPYVVYYWTERMKWSQNAGIRYWKVDWGDRHADHVFRRWLTDTARHVAPDLVIEHAACRRPFNDQYDENNIGRAEKSWIENCTRVVSYSDVVRLYDHSNQLGVPTMLERIAQVLRAVTTPSTGLGLIHCEHEGYMAAALGLNIGEMRHQFIGGPDVFFSNPKQCKRRLDEVTRAIRWQRLAPPFGAGRCPCYVDDKILFDEYDFSDKTFWTGDTLIRQGAPARISRGIELPRVSCEGLAPYVAASRYPNGAVAIATFGRLYDKNTAYKTPEADVVLNVGKLMGPIGIFGYYKNLTLIFDKDVDAGVHVWGQDPASDQARDITHDVKISGRAMAFGGDLIAEVGLSGGSPDDLSDPAMVLSIIK